MAPSLRPSPQSYKDNVTWSRGSAGTWPLACIPVILYTISLNQGADELERDPIGMLNDSIICTFISRFIIEHVSVYRSARPPKVEFVANFERGSIL